MLGIITPMIPKHKTYVEAFVGGGALFWNKEPSSIEVINDKNGYVANFYRVAKNQFDELNTMIQDTLHDEYTYNVARDMYRERRPASPVEMAWAFWVGCNMSFAGSCFDGSFQITSNSNDISHPGRRSKNKRKVFQHIGNRLENTMILAKDALDVIQKYDNEDTFIYCDPPYFQANQGHYKGYKKSDFEQLLKLTRKSRSKILISCYFDQMIEDYQLDYREIEMRLGVVNNKMKKECLVYNYSLPNDKWIQKGIFDNLNDETIQNHYQ